MKEIKNLEPDFTKKKFEIIITVHENCSSIQINHFDDTPATYEQIIGALEIQKAMYLYDQSTYNRKMFNKKKKS